MSYTLVDCHHTGYLIDKPYFLSMFPFIFYENGEVGISEEKEMVSQVMRLQNLIQEMYINVYFNEKVKQFERLIEKAVELEIASSILHPKWPEKLILTPEKVWGMSEGALLYRLRNSDNFEVTQLLRRYSRNELYQTVMEFKIEKKGRRNVTENNGKIQKFVNKEFSNAFIKKYSNPLNLTRLERKISDATEIPFVHLLVTLSADPKRIMPQNTAIYTPYGQKIGMLFEMNPEHYHSLVEKADDFFALRVYVQSAFKDQFTPTSETVKRIIEENTKK